MRDHSALELIQKLERKYPKEEVREAIKIAESDGYILEPNKLSQKVASRLGRQFRGIIYINRYLVKKGLPKINIDWDNEFEKARKAALKKFKEGPPYDLKQKQALFRYLLTRGFDSATSKKIVHRK